MARTLTTFIVIDKAADPEDERFRPRLMRAAKVSHVAKRVVSGFEIRPATDDELVTCGRKDVLIVDVAPPSE